MATILVGDWECTFQEIRSVFDDPSIRNQKDVLAQLLGTTGEFIQSLEHDLERNKVNLLNVLIQLIVEWRSRNPKTATLIDLRNIIRTNPEWKQITHSLEMLIVKKSKGWNEIGSDLKHIVYSSKVEFQDHVMELMDLKFLLKEKFDRFIEKNVNQWILQQVGNNEVLKITDVREGFLTSQVSEDTNISYLTTFELGIGSGCTVVYKGKFGLLDVAVKKISNFRHHKEADNEIQFLLNCDGHPNIVRYYGSKKQDDVYLLALELCREETLKDWLNDSKCLPVQIKDLDILRQTTEGLSFLHEKNIIHRDLKPSNILFSILGKHVFVKIADFGISRLLPAGEASRTVTSYGGSCGWTAAEMIEAKLIYIQTGTWKTSKMPKLTKKTDIFSLGCIFYAVLTHGKHPFGADDTLHEHNIKMGTTQISTDNFTLSLKCNIDLVTRMIAKSTSKRPDTEYILAHPIFWSHQKMIDFILEVSNISHRPCGVMKYKVARCVKKFEKTYFPKISNNDQLELGWFASLGSEVTRAFMDANYDIMNISAIKLVRLIRNLNNHYNEIYFNNEISYMIGERPHEFVTFWLEHFPTLINELREAFSELSGKSCLKQFYSLKSEPTFVRRRVRGFRIRRRL